MAPRDPSHEPNETPDPIEKGFATFATLRYEFRIAGYTVTIANVYGEANMCYRIGVKAFVEKVSSRIERLRPVACALQP